MTADEARALLDVQEPIPLAWTSKDGTPRDDDGDAIDHRQTVPWVWAVGPFGSWPETMAVVEGLLTAHKEWFHAQTIRIGRAVMYDPPWGFAAKEEVQP